MFQDDPKVEHLKNHEKQNQESNHFRKLAKSCKINYRKNQQIPPKPTKFRKPAKLPKNGGLKGAAILAQREESGKFV